MTFSVDHESGNIIASIRTGERIETYECAFSTCKNPVCTCQDVYIDFLPLRTGEVHDSEIVGHRVVIDCHAGTLVKEGKEATPVNDLSFGRLFVSELSEEDYALLWDWRLAFKNKISETADLASIDVVFEYDEVEGKGLTSAYNDVLPFGDRLHLTIGDRQYMVFDQFCVQPKCNCTETFLTLAHLDLAGKSVNEVGTISLDYRKRQWREIEGTSSSVPVKAIRSAMEVQVPDIYQRLRARHVKLKAIYAHSKKRHYMPREPLEMPVVGRNDPCPCGSGKKYKKCCLGKNG